MRSLPGKRLCVRISDNGPGIPKDLRRKIFGRFVRVGNELERAKPGTGLGLYLVRSLVKNLRGTIRVEDRRGQVGTEFEVILPGIRLADVSVASGCEQSHRAPTLNQITAVDVES
ncbi:MAG: ATP-binding protein [Pirellulaceae bacterium]